MTRRFSFTERAQAVAASTNSGRPGDLILQPGKGYLYSPGYNIESGKDGITVFRILPIFDKSTGQFTPFYDGGDFGDWIRVYSTIQYFGNDKDNQASFILDDGSGIMNATQHPTAVLRSAVKRALATGSDPGGWYQYVEGQKPFLPEAKAKYFVQVALVHLNKPLGEVKGLNSKPYVLGMSQSAGNALTALVQTPITDATLAQRSGSQDPIQLQFEHGDPVGLHDGRWIVMYKAGNGDPRTRQATVAPAAQQSLFGQQPLQMALTSEDKKAFAAANSYACYTEYQMYGLPANFLAGAAEQQSVALTTQPWEDILYFPTIEEQVRLCATRVPYTMLEYAFMNRPDWLGIVRQTLKMDEVNMGWGSTAGPTHPPTGVPSAFANVPAGPPANAFGTQVPQPTGFGGAVAAPLNAFGAPVATSPQMQAAIPQQATPQTQFASPAATVFPGSPAGPVTAPSQATVFPGGAAAPFGGVPAAPVTPTIAPMANPGVFAAPNPAAASAVPLPPAQPAAGPFTPPPATVNPTTAMLNGMTPQPPAAASPLAATAFAAMQQAAAAQGGMPMPSAEDPADGAPF